MSTLLSTAIPFTTVVETKTNSATTVVESKTNSATTVVESKSTAVPATTIVETKTSVAETKTVTASGTTSCSTDLATTQAPEPSSHTYELPKDASSTTLDAPLTTITPVTYSVPASSDAPATPVTYSAPAASDAPVVTPTKAYEEPKPTEPCDDDSHSGSGDDSLPGNGDQGMGYGDSDSSANADKPTDDSTNYLKSGAVSHAFSAAALAAVLFVAA